MDDVNTVLCSVRAPVLGVGVAAGPNRAALAALAAVRDAARVGGHTLVVLAFPPGEARLGEYKVALDTVRAEFDSSATVICGGCDDERLAAGSVRVSVLAG